MNGSWRKRENASANDPFGKLAPENQAAARDRHHSETSWRRRAFPFSMKLFYSGPVVNAELLVTMLEKHGIVATQEFEDPNVPDEEDLNRPAKVFVPSADYERAHRLFYGDREDEL